MGRIFETCPGRHAWNLEKCEEEVLIAGYDEILRFIPADQTWKAEFEYHFFDRGNGLAFEALAAINGIRREHALDTIVIRETDIYDYGHSTDRLLKAHRRRQVWEEFKSASAEVRRHRLERAKLEAGRLTPPRMTFEEWKQWRQEDATPPTKPTLQPDLAARMLALASPSIWDEIIPRLTAEGALEVAERSPTSSCEMSLSSTTLPLLTALICMRSNRRTETSPSHPCGQVLVQHHVRAWSPFPSVPLRAPAPATPCECVPKDKILQVADQRGAHQDDLRTAR
jgi:hypothetical protein